MQPVRLGVVGAGIFGINHVITFKQMEARGEAVLVALADVDGERLQQVERDFGVHGYEDWRGLLEKEKLDALSIATPDHLHREVAVAALDQDLHVHVEKPMATTVDDCRRMLAACEKAGKLLQVDFHKRYDPYHQAVRDMVRAGKIGQPLYGYVHMEDRIEVPRDWFPHWAPQSSPVWFLGVHFIDLVRWVLGSDGARVRAVGQRRKLSSLGVETWDSIQSQVEFANGAVVTFDTSWILPDGFESIVNQGVRLVGTEGLIEIDTQDRGLRTCFNGDGKVATVNPGFIYETERRDGSKLTTGYGIQSIEDFVHNVAWLKKGHRVAELKGIYASADDGLEVTKIAAAAHESLERNSAVVEIEAEG